MDEIGGQTLEMVSLLGFWVGYLCQSFVTSSEETD